MIPAKGVYAVEAMLDEEALPGVCNIGVNPTFGETQACPWKRTSSISTAIFTDRKLRVSFIERLRDEKKFASLEELAQQIEKDAQKARAILNSI